MCLEKYRTRLTSQLCWYCDIPTNKSHQAQRQCPKCGRKFSYRHRLIEFRLLEAFCSHLNSHAASRKHGISYPTALKHYERFEIAVRRSDPELWWRFKEHSKEQNTKRTINEDLLEFLYEKLIWPNEIIRKPKRKRNQSANS